MSERNGLPRGWVIKCLGELVAPKRLRVSPTGHNDLPFIGMEHVESNSMRVLGSVPAGTMKSSAAHFQADDVLYGRLRPYLNKVAQPGIEGLCSAEFIVFPNQEHLRSTFLKYRLNASDFVSFASHLNEGDRPRVDFEQIKSFLVRLPPEPEQRRIVAKIEELFSDLDAGVAALERIRANLKRYRAAVLKAAVEGKLSQAWRAKHPHTEPATKLLDRILAERRQKWEENQLAKFAAAGKTPPKGWREKYIEPAAPDTNGLPELPPGWCWATIEQVSHFAKYGSSAKTVTNCTGVPVLRMGNIQDGSLDLEILKYLPQDHDEFPDLLLRGGDLLFNRTNSAELVGKSAVYHGNPSPCSYASYLIGVRMVIGCDPEFVCYYLNSRHGRAWIASVVSQQVGQANVNGTKLQALVFPLPPVAEQSQIIAEVELRFSNIAAAQAQVDANLKRAARLRQSILKRAFEGKLVPQDPNDEPAEQLLERIRRARETASGHARETTSGGVTNRKPRQRNKKK